MLYGSDRHHHDKAACQSKSTDFVPFIFFALTQKHEPCQYTSGYRDTAMASSASGKLRARRVSYLALKSPELTPT